MAGQLCFCRGHAYTTSMSFLTRRPTRQREGNKGMRSLGNEDHALNERQLRERYVWTSHARMKMRHYRLTEARIKRIIRHPVRVEEGIFPGAIACMHVAEGKKYSEIWTFYTLGSTAREGKKITIISAWRYPGKSPSRDPIPPEILREIRSLM